VTTKVVIGPLKVNCPNMNVLSQHESSQYEHHDTKKSELVLLTEMEARQNPT
jgi:hypothetical protein